MRNRRLCDGNDPVADGLLEGKIDSRGRLQVATFGDGEGLAWRWPLRMRMLEAVMHLVRRRIGQKQNERRRNSQIGRAIRAEISLRRHWLQSTRTSVSCQ